MSPLRGSFLTNGQFILITGISGSGKSSYGKHLGKTHGYHFIPTDERTDFIGEAVYSNDGLVARYRNKHGHVAVEWGFLPQLLHYVLALKEQARDYSGFSLLKKRLPVGVLCKMGGDPSRLRLWRTRWRGSEGLICLLRNFKS